MRNMPQNTQEQPQPSQTHEEHPRTHRYKIPMFYMQQNTQQERCPQQTHYEHTWNPGDQIQEDRN